MFEMFTIKLYHQIFKIRYCNDSGIINMEINQIDIAIK